tara:strand:- start:215 stop:769 length:555 start_codon:yes stop_codon:yes gene_type:complete
MNESFRASTILKYISNNRGYAPSSRYKININNPSIAKQRENDMVGHTCHSLSIPGISFEVEDYTQGYGSTYPFPVQQEYENVEMTFRCTQGSEDNGLPEYRFFQEWINRVANRESGTIGFKDDYASDIDIEYLDSQMKSTFKLRLLSAYPTNVGAIELTYEGMDQIEFTVEMAYDIWLANSEIN